VDLIMDKSELLNSDEDIQKLMRMVCVGSSNLRLRVDAFLDYYHDTLWFWRKSNPKQYIDELNKAKRRFENGVANAEVEMLAMTKVDYEYMLEYGNLDHNDISPFVSSLNDYDWNNKFMIAEEKLNRKKK
jgi:hypothetical protein